MSRADLGSPDGRQRARGLFDSLKRRFDASHRERPDVVVWSMRGLLGLSDPEDVLRQVHLRLGARCTLVASDAVTSLVGALGEVRDGALALGWHVLDGGALVDRAPYLLRFP